MTTKILSFLVLVILFILPVVLFAQETGVISGRVVRAGSSEGLSGVSIVVANSNRGTTTDENGYFKLAANFPVTVVFSATGFSTERVTFRSAEALTVSLNEYYTTGSEVVVSATRTETRLLDAPVTVEKLGTRQLLESPAATAFDALQNLKGVDLLTQSLTFKSVNVRGFGANNNNRFVQLIDGLDSRSPGLGFGFGNSAGVSDLDVASIEILPGASSALYGPDALQGLQLTRTKSPFEYQGLSAYVKVGANNFGSELGGKPYSDVAVRYARKIGERFAFKINFATLNGSDFIADDYNDRSTRGRRNFFAVDSATQSVKIAYVPNNNPSTNFEYDGVNIYGDDVTNGGSFDFNASNTSNAALVGRRVTRTGYTESQLIDNNGKVFSTRANVSVAYKLTDKIEVNGAWYYGNGNFIRTAGFREYFPDYKRNQFKLEVNSPDFFIRSYTTRQKAEGYNLGNLAARLLQIAKPTAQWAQDFAAAYNGDIVAARAGADNNKFAVGSAEFNDFRNRLISTNNNVRIPGAGENGIPAVNGVRLLDNSSLVHTEGMYKFDRWLPKQFEVLTGASWRRYKLESENTIFATGNAGNSINEYGWYLQGSYKIALSNNATFQPTAAVRYDKNSYFKGGFTPRISGNLSFGEHHFRGSWQSAFRNPSPNQLLSDGSIGEVGGTRAALEAAGLYTNQGYTEASVNAYRNTVTPANPNGDESVLRTFTPQPENFTTEKIKTWEVGYKTLVAKKLFIDAFYFSSRYEDFIAAQNIIQPTTGQVADLRNSSTSRTYQVNFNNLNEIFVQGFGIGAEYKLGRGYTLSGNYAYQVGKITLRDLSGNVRKDAFGRDIVKKRMSDPEVAALGRNFFISPENRYNVSISNPSFYKAFGFAVTYRWTDKTWVEQGNTQGDVWLPSWNSVDAQVSYRLTKPKATLKIGGSNIFNKYYSQGYGLARIGGLYYAAVYFDDLLN